MSLPRSLEEIKEDIRSRVGRRAPFLHADKTEAEAALAKLTGVEGEPWAAVWSELGARWEKKARAEEAAGHSPSAREAYLKAYGYYGIARHPFPNSPGKQAAYRKTCAPLLLVNGKEDKQVPIEDFYLLLESGNPKTARLFSGGHMGNIAEIFSTVIDWLHGILDGPGRK